MREALDSLTPSEMYSIADGIWPRTRRSGPIPTRRDRAFPNARRRTRSATAAISRAWGTPEADAGELLSPRAAEPEDFPDSDGLFEPDHGGELGIESALLGRRGRPDGRAARAIECAGSGVDPEGGGTDLCLASGRLAGAAEEPAVGGRRSAGAEYAGRRRMRNELGN